jgi:hypothetical protein
MKHALAMPEQLSAKQKTLPPAGKRVAYVSL